VQNLLRQLRLWRVTVRQQWPGCEIVEGGDSRKDSPHSNNAGVKTCRSGFSRERAQPAKAGPAGAAALMVYSPSYQPILNTLFLPQ
jgi:hypothetical protein